MAINYSPRFSGDRDDCGNRYLLFQVYREIPLELLPYEIPGDVQPRGIHGDLDQHVSEVLLADEILVGRSLEVSKP